MALLVSQISKQIVTASKLLRNCHYPRIFQALDDSF
jgi:hypothetical protein